MSFQCACRLRLSPMFPANRRAKTARMGLRPFRKSKSLADNCLVYRIVGALQRTAKLSTGWPGKSPNNTFKHPASLHRRKQISPIQESGRRAASSSPVLVTRGPVLRPALCMSGRHGAEKSRAAKDLTWRSASSSSVFRIAAMLDVLAITKMRNMRVLGARHSRIVA